MSQCTGCRAKGKTVMHPLLEVPICMDCNSDYHNGDFIIEDGNEIYCRMCGQGQGVLISCDTCPMSFCGRCISNCFGAAEFERIKNLSDRWSCLVCAPQLLRDLRVKNGWKPATTTKQTQAEEKKTRPGLICHDITRGREKIDIPCINEVDDAPAPLDFCYVTEPVVGEGGKLTNNPNFVSCCSCTDDCSDPTKCECILNSGGLNYDANGRLIKDKASGIYECNYRCSCNINKCFNRVVGRGPRAKLEVFRCEDTRKGWGVRCATDLQPGTFIADYLGEVVPEAESERRGLTLSDEYLFTLDCWGRSNACVKLKSLGLKSSLATIPRQQFVFAHCMDRESLLKYFDMDLIDLMDKRGAIERAKKRRLEPKGTTGSSSSSNGDKSISASQGVIKQDWLSHNMASRSATWTEARSIITDRTIIQTEEMNEVFIIDARWNGSVGRFLNHSCGGNLDVVMVFCEYQDVRIPRVSFFANDFIPAGTELCYDYGYLPGNVEGKHRACLCGAANCRKTLY